ncbi:hypothetical protein ACWDA3_27725 [Nonomuraea rubra]
MTDHLLRHSLRVFDAHSSEGRQVLSRVWPAAMTLDHRPNGPEDHEIVSGGS